MKIELIDYPDDQDWLRVKNAALLTIHKKASNTPDDMWREKILLSRHSPIRRVMFEVIVRDLPYWIHVHFKNHHMGVDEIGSTQRNDIQHKYDRRKAPQDALMDLNFWMNAQAVINISESRLCLRASKETREVWQEVLEVLRPVAPQLVQVCVKPCVHMGGPCREVFAPCGYNHTPHCDKAIEDYQSLFYKYDPKGKR